MIWYFKDEVAYEFPSGKEVSNDLTKRYRNSVYEDSDEMELYYALAWMKENKIDKMSVVFPVKDLSVQYGNEEDINKDYCKKGGVHYRYENRSGGSIVLFPGNIIFLDIYPTNNFFRQHEFLGDLVKYLQARGIKAVTNNNDIMVDGKKVVGAVSETLVGDYKGWVYFGATISVNADAKLIDQICTKQMNKIPGSLSDYKITTEDMMKFTLDWFDSHRYEDK